MYAGYIYLIHRATTPPVIPWAASTEFLTPTIAPLLIQKPVAIPTPIPTVIEVAKPTPILIPLATQPSQPANNKLCLNYGHQTNDYDLLDQVNSDLTRIKDSGITCLRLAYEHWNYHRMLDLAEFAKSKGFRVIVGGYFGDLSEDKLDAYKAEVLEQAKWAQANHIDQLSLGNEQEYKMSISSDQWYGFLLEMAEEVRAVYSGIISYETSGTMHEFWLDKSLGEIDMLGFNMYSGYNTNTQRLQKFITAHGKERVYVSETNADMELEKFHDDFVHAQTVAQNTLPLLELGIPVYFFTYATCNSSVENYWGLYQCGELAQPETAKALGIED
jgi:exo-beta-1,3-glucanase (GH17 family)